MLCINKIKFSELNFAMISSFSIGWRKLSQEVMDVMGGVIRMIGIMRCTYRCRSSPCAICLSLRRG